MTDFQYCKYETPEGARCINLVDTADGELCKWHDPDKKKELFKRAGIEEPEPLTQAERDNRVQQLFWKVGIVAGASTIVKNLLDVFTAVSNWGTMIQLGVATNRVPPAATAELTLWYELSGELASPLAGASPQVRWEIMSDWAIQHFNDDTFKAWLEELESKARTIRGPGPFKS